jgi:toxin-antitoxin system PIN domain toxin
MSKSMTSSFLPDINVWIALHYEAHRHHAEAVAWFRSLDDSVSLVFCRHTQTGMFRLLTTGAVMDGAPLTQKHCWGIYAQWMDGGRAFLHAEPSGLDAALQRLTSSDAPSPKTWADAYLAAFAENAHLTLVTFDRALAAKANGAVLLS